MVSVLAMTIVAFMGLAFDSSYFYYESGAHRPLLMPERLPAHRN